MIYPYVQAYNDYGRRKGPILAFVVHMAEGGGTVGYLSRDNARGVSVHYVIERSGRIVQMLLESHASGSINPRDLRTTEGPAPYGISVAKEVLGSWVTDPNSAVISLEIEGYAKDGPNADQNAALLRLVNDVRSRYPTIGLLGHRDFVDYKACPGAHIPWDALGGHGPYTSETDVPLIAFTLPQTEVAGRITVKDGGAEVITIDGGERPRLAAGLVRPAIGGVPGTSDQLKLAIHGDDAHYLVFIGTTEIGFVSAGQVTFEPYAEAVTDTTPYSTSDLMTAELAAKREGYDLARAGFKAVHPAPTYTWPPRP